MTNKRKISRHFYFLSIIICVGLFLLTTIAGLYYVYSIKQESAVNVAKVVEGLIRSGRYREAVNSLSNVKLGSFDAIGYYDQENNRVFILPPTLGPDYFKEEKGSLSKIMTSNIPIDIFFDETNHDKAGTMIFTYNHSNAAKALLFFYMIGMAFFLPVLQMFKRHIRRGVEKDLLEEKNRGIKETVRQVWHDLNQPMQLLHVMVESGRGMEPEVKDKIQSACEDMRAILDDLKERRDQFNTSEINPVCLASTLKEISEKESIKLSLENKPVSLVIQDTGLESFSNLNEAELKRIISNIVDNASRASSKGKEIIILLSQKDSFNCIQVIDQGEGIKPEHLAMIGKRGVSFRKFGNGLGISYAIEKIEQWGGKFNISSEYGVGTTVEIELPQAPVPEWFSGKLNLTAINEFILTDDRPVIHTLVKERLEQMDNDMKKYFHHSSEEFNAWYAREKDDLISPLFVFDYDIGEEGITGLDIIKKFDLSSQSILMTNYYDDPLIQEKAHNARVRIYPKALINYMGIQ